MIMMLQSQYVLNLASKGLRIDKRKQDEFRKIEVEKNPIDKAEGSARVRMGKTDVLVGVKMGIGEPFPDKPDEGTLIVCAEFSPLASPDFETGPPRENAIELARVVDRGIRESGAIDTKKLCIKKEEKVWMVYVDIQILNHDGNLMDAAALAAITALLGARIPEYDGKTINYEKKTKKLPMIFKPVPVTIVKVAGNLFVDPSLDEENVMGARLTVTTKDDGNVCSLQKGGSEPLLTEEIEKAFDLAVEKGKELRKLVG
jgi:exosome complex component RRP42